MELIPSNLKVDFLSKRYFAYALSLIVIAFSLFEWYSLGEKKFGIDYLGGHELVVKIDAESSSGEIRGLMEKAKLDAIVQSFESDDQEFSIRISSEKKSGEVRELVSEALKGLYSNKFEIIKADFVGPTIGEELKKNALIAILVSLVGMLLYISFRFELAFAVGAVAALFHDVIVTMGIYLISDMTISVATLAAALTIVGYSVNDTIIIFDRVREEILKARENTSLEDIINQSISSTLSRTVITSLLTLFSALALLIFGGGAIAELALFLSVGVVTGTYSTIFIASPVALAWESFQSRASTSGKPKKASSKEATAS
ncbi:MAG: protein translocase subunit SecF [Bdellovibrionales bacterium]|nr:protein translocase subunit SecF [Bdellovibrionales bacterium]